MSRALTGKTTCRGWLFKVETVVRIGNEFNIDEIDAMFETGVFVRDDAQVVWSDRMFMPRAMCAMGGSGSSDPDLKGHQADSKCTQMCVGHECVCVCVHTCAELLSDILKVDAKIDKERRLNAQDPPAVSAERLADW